MIRKIRRYMVRQHMSEWREPLWVAVSGGIDSMVLLHVLHALRHPLKVVHIDHGLRGAESEADQQFVKEHCERLRIPFTGMKVDVDVLAQEEGISIQMAARELRYDIFRKLTAEGPARLALAHHQDDAIETLFIQLMQGMGLHGWRTIPPVSGPFIRPLMCATREEILAYAEEHEIVWREDPSNAEQGYLRNKIRHDLLPMLEGWRPGVRRSLSRNVDLFREMDHAARMHLEGIIGNAGTAYPQRVPISTILDHDIPRLMLHHLLRAHGFHPDRLDDILFAMEEGSTGATFNDGGMRVTIDRSEMIIEKVGDEEPRSWSIGSLKQPPDDLPLAIDMVGPEAVDLSTGMTTAWLDPTRLELPLEYRPWRAGDRMRPVGLKGSKLISDILIDARVPRNEKGRTFVLISAGKVVWLAGHRIGEGFSARPDSERVLRIAMKQVSDPFCQ